MVAVCGGSWELAGEFYCRRVVFAMLLLKWFGGNKYGSVQHNGAIAVRTVRALRLKNLKIEATLKRSLLCVV